MRNYSLKVSDFIYPRETPVRIITLAAAFIVLVIVCLINWIVGLFFLLNIGLLFLGLYQMQMSTLGSCVKVSPTQFPNIYNMAQAAADRLDMDMPAVYIQQSPVLNAFATGFWGNYFVVLHSAIVEALSEEELMSVIGHEFTHIKGNHVIITNLTMGGVGLLKAVWWLQMIIKYVFLYLMRCQEYTCDRGGLIACGSIQGAVTSEVKLAVGKELFSRINVMEFYQQILELDKKPFGILGDMEATHPLSVRRIRQIVRYYRTPQYQRIASMQGKMGTSTLQGSLATGDLMQKIVNKGKGPNVQGSQGMGQQYSNVPQPGYQQPLNMYSQPNYNMNMQQGFNAPVSQQPSGFCKKCGTPKKEGSRFCIGCGTPYESPQSAAPAVINEPEESIIPVVEDNEVIIPVQSTEGQVAAGTEPEQYMQMKTCPKCGNKNLKGATFCTECGEKI